jgi:hypothetical protein
LGILGILELEVLEGALVELSSSRLSVMPQVLLTVTRLRLPSLWKYGATENINWWFVAMDGVEEAG